LKLYFKINKYFSAITVFFSLVCAQNWEQSYIAGSIDSESIFMGGSEILNLETHKNKLYASLGYWEDENNIWYGGSNFNLGWAQILRLDTRDGQWEVDLNLGLNFLRPEILKEVIFTKDLFGNQLENPDTILITGAYSANYFSGSVKAYIFLRNDVSSEWNQLLVYQGDLSDGENYSMRDIEIYADQITGVEYLMVSVGTKGIFSGRYNPNNEDRIELNTIPEVGPLGIRSLGITIANNNLYFSSGNKLFKRNDGQNPYYDVVHDFVDLELNINSAVGGIRGLSTILNPSGINESLLLMWCPNSQSKGTIYRLDYNETQGFERVYETKISLLIEDYLPGSTVSYILGAYNEFHPIYDQLSNQEKHIIGIESLLQAGNFPTWNGFYSGGVIVSRNNNAEYEIEEINGYIGYDDFPLVAVRCYVESPFINENAIYYGGFDPNGYSSTNQAWVYKKTFNELTINEKKNLIIENIKVEQNYPNPFNSSTIINYTLVKDKNLDIIIYDIEGKKIKSNLNIKKSSGNHFFKWDGKNENGDLVPTGIYFISLVVADQTKQIKMFLIK
jgi:hypothetical protein